MAVPAIVIVRYKTATCSDQSCGTNYYHDGSDCVACPTGSTRMPETANQCLCPENHHRSVDGGVYSCAACAQGSTRLPGDTVPGGDATTCTSSVSPPPPPPSAQALEKVAEETRDSILADIADERLKAKVKLLADAAIAGAKVQRLTARMSAADEDTACSNAFSGAGMSSGDGACVATAASSGKRRRLHATTYDVELMFSSATVSDDALTTAADALKTADGVTSVASQASVDPITELKTVPGVDTSKLQTFDTQAQAAVAAAASTPPPSIPPPTPPPPPPPPSAQALEKVAEETRDSILADIADARLKAKVKLLADAAIAGAKVQRLTAKMSAADEDTACSNAFSGAGMSSGDGACVATAASSGKRRRLSSTTYDVELMFSSATVSDDALTTAADALKTADGVTSVASQASVDPITELKTVPGVDTSKLQTFDTQAQAAVAAASTPPPSIPPPTPPPPPKPNLVLDDDDAAVGLRGWFVACVAAMLVLVLVV